MNNLASLDKEVTDSLPGWFLRFDELGKSVEESTLHSCEGGKWKCSGRGHLFLKLPSLGDFHLLF